MTTPAGPLPKWATDDSVTAGPETGQDTKLEPSASDFAQGHIAGTRTPARLQNWWQGKAGEWIADYLASAPVQNLSDEFSVVFGFRHLHWADTDVPPIWYWVAGIDSVRISSTGETWSVADDGMAANIELRCAASSPSTTVALGDDNGSNEYYSRDASGSSSGAWTTRTGTVEFDFKDVVYDSNAQNFVGVGERAPTGSPAPGIMRLSSAGVALDDQAFATSQVPDRAVFGGDTIVAVARFQTDTEFYVSQDGGGTWTTYSAPLIDNVRDIAYDASNGRFVLATVDGIWVSENPANGAGTWAQVATLTDFSIRRLGALGGLWLLHGDLSFGGSSFFYIAYSLDAGQTWRGYRTGTPGGEWIAAGDNRLMLASSSAVRMTMRAGLDRKLSA